VSATMQALFWTAVVLRAAAIFAQGSQCRHKIRQICQISEEYCFSHLFVTRMRDRECLRKNLQNSDGLLTKRASSIN
jgi:hypothetical protein